MTPAEIEVATLRVRKFGGQRRPEWLERVIAGKSVQLESWQDDFATVYRATHGIADPPAREESILSPYARRLGAATPRPTGETGAATATPALAPPEPTSQEVLQERHTEPTNEPTDEWWRQEPPAAEEAE